MRMRRRAFLTLPAIATLGTRATAMSDAFEVTSRWLVLIDPLTLDLARGGLQALAGLPEATQRQRLTSVSPHLRIGVHEIANFRPGRYRIDPADIAPSTEPGPEIVDVDSGAIAFTGLDRLPALARVLTWDVHNATLGANGDAVAQRVRAAMGGPRFAILHGDASRPFAGDGAYRLRRVRRLDP